MEDKKVEKVRRSCKDDTNEMIPSTNTTIKINKFSGVSKKAGIDYFLDGKITDEYSRRNNDEHQSLYLGMEG